MMWFLKHGVLEKKKKTGSKERRVEAKGLEQ